MASKGLFVDKEIAVILNKAIERFHTLTNQSATPKTPYSFKTGDIVVSTVGGAAFEITSYDAATDEFMLKCILYGTSVPFSTKELLQGFVLKSQSAPPTPAPKAQTKHKYKINDEFEYDGNYRRITSIRMFPLYNVIDQDGDVGIISEAHIDKFYTVKNQTGHANINGNAKDDQTIMSQEEVDKAIEEMWQADGQGYLPVGAVMPPAIESASPEAHKCICDIKDVMTHGCTCNGI